MVEFVEQSSWSGAKYPLKLLIFSAYGSKHVLTVQPDNRDY
jgi:hypothetical protein